MSHKIDHIIITVKGGVVQSVHSSAEIRVIEICDYDSLEDSTLTTETDRLEQEMKKLKQVY